MRRHITTGRALAEHKLYAEAVPHLLAALRLDPSLAEAAVTLGLLFVQQGHLERGIQAYRQAIRLGRGFADAHFNLALALLARGQEPEAKQHLEVLVRAQPGDLQAQFYLGECLLHEGQSEAAVSAFRKVLQSPNPTLRAKALDAIRAAESAT